MASALPTLLAVTAIINITYAQPIATMYIKLLHQDSTQW
jgi:hypothetical protein